MFVLVLCLSCGSCTSEVSLEDCNSKLTKITCPSGSPNCVTGKLTCSAAGQESKTVFYKRCGARGQNGCDTTKSDTPSCPSSSSTWSYSNNCCTGDNCNSGIAPSRIVCSRSSHRISSKVTAVITGLFPWIITYIY